MTTDENQQMNRLMRGEPPKEPAEPKDESETKDRKDETPNEAMNRLLRKGNQ